jgi:hypothetical protein
LLDTTEVARRLGALALGMIELGLLLPEKITRAVPPEWHEPLLDFITFALRERGAMKNVAFMPEAMPAAFRLVLNTIDTGMLWDCVRGDLQPAPVSLSWRKASAWPLT